jgi:predicted peptidase
LLPLVAALTTLASCGISDNALAPAQKMPDQPQTGAILIPPLTGPAAARHEAFCAKICEALQKAPLEARTFTDPKEAGTPLRYRFFKPLNSSRTNTFPLVLLLHGGGATRRFEDLIKCATPVFAFGPARFVSPEEQAKHPAFVVVPWSDTRGWDDLNTRLVLDLVTALCREFPIDPKRIYVTGQSMGGYGAWRMITQHADVFAAGIPVCGGGDPADAPKARDVAVWAFHGTADGIVPPSASREMIAALVKAGGKPIYWEYDGGTHAKTAERAYCEPTLLDWLFAQKKR